MDETKQSNDLGRTFLGEMGTVGCKDEKAYGCRGDERDGPGGEASKPGSWSPGATRPTVTRLSGSAGGLPSWLAQGQPLPTIGTDCIRGHPGHSGYLSVVICSVLEIWTHWPFSLYMIYATILEIRVFFLYYHGYNHITCKEEITVN